MEEQNFNEGTEQERKKIIEGWVQELNEKLKITKNELVKKDLRYSIKRYESWIK